MKSVKIILALLVLTITVNGMAFINPTSASAAKKVTLSTKKLTIKVGQSKKLKLRNNKKTVKWTVTSGKKNITLRSKKKTGVTVVGRKNGMAKVQAKAGKKRYTCKVTIKAKATTKTSKKTSSAESAQPTKAPTETPKPTGTSTEKDLSEIGLKIHLLTKSYGYTGKAVEPSVRVYNDKLYLIKNVDYTVSYSNNINVGKAQVTVKGIGKYKGEIAQEFEITKVYQSITANLKNETVYVGKTGKIDISGAYGQIEFRMSTEGVAEIDSDGTITGLRTGTIYIYLTASGDDNHYACIDRYVGRLSVMQEEASAYGFDVNSWSSNDTYKKSISNSRNDDGTNIYRAYFLCNAEEKWLDNNISFAVEDVTPTAYANVFVDLGVAYEEPEITVRSAADYVSESQQYGFDIHEPYTEDGPGSISEIPTGGKLIIVNAGASVRVVKLTAKKGDTVLDYIYLGSNGEDVSGDYSAYDVELYKKVRQKVEAQIWTDEMSNLEKLSALADYINATTHYPSTDVTSKEYNPTFWENWAVDDKELLWSMCNDITLNRIMDFQGGIVTCQAAGILETAAVDDLGLPYLYDRASDTVASGEGVWRAMGSYSSNPSNPWHESLVYKSADEEKVFLDAQGMGHGGLLGKESCEKHGCRDKIISLK